MSQEEQELTALQKYEAVKNYIINAPINELRMMLSQVHDNYNHNYNMTDELFTDYLQKTKSHDKKTN